MQYESSFHITILLFLVYFNDTFQSMETLENINYCSNVEQRYTLILLHMSRTHTRMEVNFKSVEGADNNRGTKGITSAGKTKVYKPNPGPLMHSFIHYQCF